MKIKMVFCNWRLSSGKPLSAISPDTGHFHAGTTFDGEITLSPADEEELREALAAGAHPEFWVYTPDVANQTTTERGGF